MYQYKDDEPNIFFKIYMYFIAISFVIGIITKLIEYFNIL